MTQALTRALLDHWGRQGLTEMNIYKYSQR